jgi:ABC-type multidrug transport system fused ATPase/permease subunit
MVRLIRDLLRPYHWRVAVVLAAMLLQTAMGLAGPWPLKIIIDSVVGDHPVPQWASYLAPSLARGGKLQIAALAAIMVVVIAVVTAVAGFVASYYIETVGQRVANDLRMQVFHYLQRLPLSYYRSHWVGTILSTMTADVMTIENFASHGTVSLLVDVFALVGMVTVMLMLHWDFALIAVGLLPILIFFVARLSRAVVTIGTQVRKFQADLVATAQEGLQSIDVVVACQGEDLQEQQLARISWLTVQAAVRARRVRALLAPVVVIPVAMCTAFVLWRGSALILAGSLTLGALTVFAAYLARFFGPVQNFSVHTDVIAQTAVAVRRVTEILGADNMIAEHPDAIDPPPFHGEIAFRHVAFSYADGSPVLRDVNVTINAGELVGIVGATGSGKTTLVSLIPRLYDASGGTITIDGTDIRDFSLHGLRSQIGFVLQETALFGRTVRENIAFARPDATDDEVMAAAKLANADEFIARMPDGYHSVVGDRGLKLSAGQRQRIGIARALIRNDPVLILDEPTAELDAVSEQAVVEALQRLQKGRTVICVAHRLSTIRDADKILVLKDGVVAEEGTPRELLAHNGIYARLHRIQHQESAR